MEHDDLERFLKAQEHSYSTALSEIKSGRKKSHWMWYIFPQLAGLGRSETAAYYAIRDLGQARAYMAHPITGSRLMEISGALLRADCSDAGAIFGFPDNLKLRSCMTLFAEACPETVLFQNVLDKFFDGVKDEATLRLLYP